MLRLDAPPNDAAPERSLPATLSGPEIKKHFFSAKTDITAGGRHASPSTEQLRWMVGQGISTSAMIWPTPMLVTRGQSVDDQFVFDPDSRRQWLVFREARSSREWETVDTYYWSFATGEIVSDYRGFALGEEAAMNSPASWGFDSGWLRIFATPRRWLKHHRQGIVVCRWDRAFDKLRDVPRIKVDEEVAAIFNKSMVPPRMPQVLVVRYRSEAA